MLACLIEQEAAAPDAVPLTLNTLRLACNQTSGRDPVVAYDDRTVEDTLLSLKSRGLARFVAPSAEVRTTRYRHRADERWRMGSAELAVLAVLLLGGVQTMAHVRAQAQRLHPLITAGRGRGRPRHPGGPHAPPVRGAGRGQRRPRDALGAGPDGAGAGRRPGHRAGHRHGDGELLGARPSRPGGGRAGGPLLRGARRPCRRPRAAPHGCPRAPGVGRPRVVAPAVPATAAAAGRGDAPRPSRGPHRRRPPRREPPRPRLLSSVPTSSGVDLDELAERLTDVERRLARIEAELGALR